MFGVPSVSTKLKESSGLISGYMTQAMVRLRQEDAGWSLLSGDASDMAIPFDVIKDHAARARRLSALNPIVKRGLVVRNAYMWTDPVYYKGAGPQDDKVIAANAATCFSQQARVDDELAFCTEGCVTYLVDPKRKTAFSVPVARLHNTASDTFTGRVYALLISDGSSQTDKDAKWYVIADESKIVTVDDPHHETDKTMRAVYVTVNRLNGDKYGKPDLISALYYAQAYKEYLETAHLLTKALARIAYKTTSVNARQQKAVSSRMSSSGIGGTASVGAGQDITAVSKAGAGIDFSAGTPLAAMVSAALDIPLSVLLTDGSAGGRQGAETALEDPTFKALELRRGTHRVVVESIGRALGINMTMEFGAINNDQVHRRVQSLVLAYQNKAIHQIEMRSAILQILHMADAQPIEDLPEIEQTGTINSTVGPLSDGTNDNRDNPTEA